MPHKEIFSEEQAGLLQTVKLFREDFGLVGGTAVALQLGHRESIDYDLFTKEPTAIFSIPKLRRRFERGALIGKVVVDEDPEFTFTTKTNVKVTLYRFPFRVPFTVPLDRTIDMPDLLTLAAMKGYALGRRAKWKDYVDLYFILREHPLNAIAGRAREIFGHEFNEKLLRTQMAYFEDINYTEPVVFRPGHAVADEEIKRALVEASLTL